MPCSTAVTEQGKFDLPSLCIASFFQLLKVQTSNLILWYSSCLLVPLHLSIHHCPLITSTLIFSPPLFARVTLSCISNLSPVFPFTSLCHSRSLWRAGWLAHLSLRLLPAWLSDLTRAWRLDICVLVCVSFLSVCRWVFASMQRAMHSWIFVCEVCEEFLQFVNAANSQTSVLVMSTEDWQLPRTNPSF